MTTSKQVTPARAAAYKVLFIFQQNFSRLDDLLEEELSKNDFSARDRRFLKNLTSGVVRHLRLLNWTAEQLYHGRYRKLLLKNKVILQLALYEIKFLDHIPSRATLDQYTALAKKKSGLRPAQMVSGLLHAYLRRADELCPEKLIGDFAERLAVQYSFPDWLIKRWLHLWGGEETEALCRALNRPPLFELRVNTSKISVTKFTALLDKQGIVWQASPHFPELLRVDRPQAVLAEKWIEEGWCSFQDESALLPVELLQIEKGDAVLDMCAAPGGKYGRLLDRFGGSILAVAVDMDKERLRRVKETAQRIAPGAGYFVVADGRRLPFKIRFNKILLDAPCSGLGVIRKHPDIKWRRTMREISEFARLQEELLQSAGQHVQKGGRLVYSTCTIDPLENQNVAETFLEKQKRHFQIIKPPLIAQPFAAAQFVQTFPHRHQTDGSFCTVFKKA